MNLALFDKIENTIDILEHEHSRFELIAEEITDFFSSILLSETTDEISVIYRVKSVESTREKIVRTNLAKEFEDPHDILYNIHDIIGVRIECMFIEDEVKIFNLLKSVFTKTEDGVYYFDPFMPKIRLNTVEHQPQKQKNGFDIYKVDGVYLLGRDAILFELQIKAMVNTFWSEIEHKVVYKNSAYVLEDKYVSDILNSIKSELNMIDSQLAMIYNQYKNSVSENENNFHSQMDTFISKIIHDSFADMMQKQIGFIINFKDICDTVTNYLLEGYTDDSLGYYGNTVMEVSYAVKKLQETDFRLDESIQIKPCNEAEEDTFTARVYKAITEVINIDFNWHIFCCMLTALDNKESDEEKIISFIEHYKQDVMKLGAFSNLDQIDPAMSEVVKNDLMNEIGRIFYEHKDIKLITDNGLNRINATLSGILPIILDNIANGASWTDIRDSFLSEFSSLFR